MWTMQLLESPSFCSASSALLVLAGLSFLRAWAIRRQSRLQRLLLHRSEPSLGSSPSVKPRHMLNGWDRYLPS